jgi:hypothetical protein
VKVKAEASMPTLRRGWDRDVKAQRFRGKVPKSQLIMIVLGDLILYPAKYNNYLLILYYPKLHS